MSGCSASALPAELSVACGGGDVFFLDRLERACSSSLTVTVADAPPMTELSSPVSGFAAAVSGFAEVLAADDSVDGGAVFVSSNGLEFGVSLCRNNGVENAYIHTQ